MASVTPDPVARLQAWTREIPRAWETQKQFERRVRQVGARFKANLAQPWIEEELAAAAILWDPRYDESGIEWSDLRCAALRTADDAWRQVTRQGGDYAASPVERVLYARERMLEVVEDGPAFRDFAAEVEWSAQDTQDWIELADAYEAVGECRAAEAFVAYALGRTVFEDADRVSVTGIRVARGELRGRLRKLMDANG